MAFLKFVDIDKNTGNISLNDLKKKISAKTRAISFVHWAGNPVDLDELRKQRLRDYIPNLYNYLEDCVWDDYGKK